MDCGATALAADDRLRLQILGPLRVWRGRRELDVGPRQQACLLAILLARAGHPVATGHLIDLIWDDDAPASALNVIHKYVGALRRILEPSLPARSSGSHIIRRGNGYLFTSGTAVLDIEEFHEHVRLAKHASVQEQSGAALMHYEQALALWKGAAGADLDHGRSAADVFTAINAEFLDVCVTAADLAVSMASAQRMAAPLRTAATIAPLHEPIHAALISVLGASGHQAEALELFRSTRQRLVDELGVDPGQALQRAHQRVLDQQAVAPAAERTMTTPSPSCRDTPPHSARFVGRVPETALAVTAVDAATGGGTGLVLVEGEPGIGKTRFCEEIESAAARHGAVVAWGNCPPSEGTPAMWPWVQALEALLHGLSEQRQRHWRGDAVGQLLNAADTEITPRPPDSGARFHLFQRATTLIAESAARQPVVLIIDDLHWADPCSLELFAHLATHLPDAVALVGGFRDRAPAPRSGLTHMLATVSRVPGLRRIRLGPLNATQVAELIRVETLQSPDEDAVRRIHQRTAGNPFFVRELSRLLTHNGQLDGDAAVFVEVPASVRDIVIDRLAGLAGDDMELLITAALIGRTVDVNVLAHATGLHLQTCLQRLESFDELDILTATPDPFEVRFVHDLVRDAVIAQATSYHTTRLHAQIAEALEYCYPQGESVEERLAHHLRAAGPRVAPSRTARALVLAARRMASKCAFETAEQRLATAIQVSRRAGLAELELDALAELIALVGMRSMYGSAGLTELSERAERLATSLGREREAAGLLYSRWAAHAQAIELGISRPLAQRLLKNGRTSDDPVVRAYGFQAWGIQQWNAGDIGEAYRYLQRSREHLLDALTNEHDDPVRRDLQWLMAGMLAETTALHGDTAAARELLELMQVSAGQTPYNITVWATFSCRIAVLTDDPYWAMDAARRGVAVDPGFDFAFLGTYQRLAGFWAEAQIHHDPVQSAMEAEALITANLLDPARSCVATWYVLLAEMWLTAGRRDNATRTLDRAEYCLHAYGQRYCEGLLLLTRARLLRASGAPADKVHTAFHRAHSTSHARGAHLFAQRAQAAIDEIASETCRSAV